MIHGVTIRRARTRRTTIARRTAPANTSVIASEPSLTTVWKRDAGNSPSRNGDSVAKADLTEPRGDLSELGVVATDADLVGSLRDITDDRIAYGRPPGTLLESSQIEICHPLEIVLAADVLGCGRTHPRADALVPGQKLENCCQCFNFELV